MSRKITPEEFLKRFYRNFPEAKIELLNYTAISNPLTIKCCQCGKRFTKQRAREFLAHYDCCGSQHNIQRVEKLIKYYNRCKDYSYVKAVDCNNIIIKHNICGNEFCRTLNAAMDNPESCPYCNTISTLQQLTLSQAQAQIDEKFNGQIKVLDYKGQLQKNHYKCLKCGFIFTQKQVCLLQSKGCPKCDCHKSNGERQLERILEANQLCFKDQVAFVELPRQHFDFGVYDDCDQLLYLIEVQGEQHYEQRIFPDPLEVIQKRDQRKRDFCATHKIPLYEIVYKKGKLLNLEILPLNSTTISANESK